MISCARGKRNPQKYHSMLQTRRSGKHQQYDSKELSIDKSKKSSSNVKRKKELLLEEQKRVEPHAGLEPAASRLEVLRATIALVGLPFIGC